MRVVGVMDFGGPERLQVYDVPDRSPVRGRYGSGSTERP